ncbi:MAG: ROK family protein [Armatimonadetes bacterium]|nr:ROK family protein [Armatimonadota bacterium]
MPHNLLLAFDIGGTKLAVGIAQIAQFRQTGTFDMLVKEPIPSPGTPDVVVQRLMEIGRQLIANANGQLAGIGISIGGPLDHLTGTVLNFPHLPGWLNIPLRQQLSEAFGAPAWLDNDANLGALAEHRLGAGKGADTMVYLTISTGIGGGVIVNGKLHHGVASGAGEMGHITVQTDGPRCACGNHGCLETMASGTAIARRAGHALSAYPERGGVLRQMLGAQSQPTAQQVFAAAAAGDQLAQELWEETAKYLAIGLGSIIHVLAPEVIVLGGGVAQTGEGLLDPVRRNLANHVFYIPLPSIQVLPAALGHNSAVIGAGLLAAERLT